MNKKILSIISFVFLIALAANVLAVGISPSFFYLDDVARGNPYEKNFRALNLETSDVNAEIIATGDAADWIKFYDVDTDEELENIYVSSKSSVLFKAVFDVPEDAPNGVYEGHIGLSPILPDSKDTKINVVTRSIYRLTITGNEKLSGTIDSITTQDTESGQALRVQYGFRNTGNIGATPSAEITVEKNGQFVDSQTFEGEYVKMGTFFNQEFFWDTENRGTGDFTANVKIFLNEKVISEKDLTFNIAPRGTYTVEGLVGDITKPEDVTIGSVAKSGVKFFNKGKIDVSAKVVAEVTKNGKVVDVIQGDEISINAGGAGDLLFYFKPSEEGKYEINPKVIYGGKESALDPFTIEVKSEEEGLTSGNLGSSSNTLMIVLIGLVAVLILVLAVFGYFYFKKLY